VNNLGKFGHFFLLMLHVCLRSKSWVEEEGEVFRKGTQLLTPEDFEADYAGEDLRKEVRSSHLHDGTFICIQSCLTLFLSVYSF